MKRKDIVNSLVIAGHFETKKAAEVALRTIESTITSAVSKGTSVDLFGFGKFLPVLQKGKSGKVPGTDRTYITQDKMVPRFKAAKAFKDTVAGK